MVHFSCDRCGQELSADHHQRYVVRISVYPGVDAHQITDQDLEADHMEEIASVLKMEQMLGLETGISEERHHFRYDLCRLCHQKYLNDPLGQRTSQTVDLNQISQN